jgi:hypothetical protein
MDNFIDVSVTNDITADILKSLGDLAKKTVCVGIPQEENVQHSSDDIHSKITNAQLAFIHTNGVREKTMREEMQHNLDSGVPYSKAHEMYIHSHGSALWQIPPRPIIEPAIEDDMQIITGLLKDALKAALDGDSQLAEEYLNKAGLEGQAATQDWFTSPKNGWPGNSPLTVSKKKSDKPLIDTGELRKAITYVIRENK